MQYKTTDHSGDYGTIDEQRQGTNGSMNDFDLSQSQNMFYDYEEDEYDYGLAMNSLTDDSTKQCFCLQNISNRLLFSRSYLVFYACVIFVQIFLMVYLFRWDFIDGEDYEPETWFIILDLVVIAIMVVEVLLRIMSRGTLFFKSKWNILDICVLLLCVLLSLGTYLIHLELVFWHWREALVLIRCILQAVRVVFMIRAHVLRQRLVVKDQDKIIFTKLPAEALEDMAKLNDSFQHQRHDQNSTSFQDLQRLDSFDTLPEHASSFDTLRFQGGFGYNLDESLNDEGLNAHNQNLDDGNDMDYV